MRKIRAPEALYNELIFIRGKLNISLRHNYLTGSSILKIRGMLNYLLWNYPLPPHVLMPHFKRVMGFKEHSLHINLQPLIYKRKPKPNLSIYFQPQRNK